MVVVVMSSILSEAAAGSLGPMQPNVGRPCEAPRSGPRREEGPGAPGSAARREQRSGRRREPSAGSQLPARPLPKWRMRTSFARRRPFLWPWHPRLFRRGPGQLSFPCGAPAPLSPIPSSPSAPKKEKERASPRPVLPSRYQFSSTTWRGVPWRGRLACLRSGPGCRRHRHAGAGASRAAPQRRELSQVTEGVSFSPPVMVCLANDILVWERLEHFYRLLSQQHNPGTRGSQWLKPNTQRYSWLLTEINAFFTSPNLSDGIVRAA